MSEGQKTGIKLWKPWSSLHFHYFTALQHFPLDACLLASLSSPQFPWCLTCCLQTATVFLHCFGILKIYTATYSVKLHYILIHYKLIYYAVFSLWIFDYDILRFCGYLCLFCLMFFRWAIAFSSCHFGIFVLWFSSSWVLEGCRTAGNPSEEGGRTLKAAWRASITTGTTLRTSLAGRSWTPPALWENQQD